jgi:hypothetical protein
MIDATVIAPIATAALAAIGAGARAVWLAVQRGRLDCLERCAALTLELKDQETEAKAREAALQAELKAERLEHWKTRMSLERLLGKLEREQGNSSSRPPSSTSR